MDILDCPIRELPSKGGRFSYLKACHTKHKLGNKLTIRQFLLGIKLGQYCWITGPLFKQILIFLMEDNHINLENKKITHLFKIN